MATDAHIRYIRRGNISDELWNNCVELASNSLIYAQTWYLDAMCDQWDALVLNDYEAVMPLPWRKKWGIRYIYQPAFIQRLGVFGKNVNQEKVQLFFYECTNWFTYMHAGFGQPWHNSNSLVIAQKNFIIDLEKPYEYLRKSYTFECNKNIRKAAQRGCKFVENIPVDTVIEMYQTAYSHLHTAYSKKDYDQFAKLAHTGISKNKAATYGIVNDSGTLIYSALLFKDSNRLYYLAGAPTKEGRSKRATYFFIDKILQQHAGASLFFDFEGSDIPDVAAFYQRFGPATEIYYTVKCNNLPWWIRWLKR